MDRMTSLVMPGGLCVGFATGPLVSPIDGPAGIFHSMKIDLVRREMRDCYAVGSYGADGRRHGIDNAAVRSPIAGIAVKNRADTGIDGIT